MTFTATPEPSNLPPRVFLEIDSDVSGASFTSLTVTRNGEPILQQPTLGASDASVYDYLAPFDQSVEYIADGSFLPFVAPEFTELWASLASWTGDTGSYSVGPYSSGPLLVEDTFTRADSASSLGSPETGSAWIAEAGTWGVASNKGYCVTGVAADWVAAVVETGAANVVAEVTMSTMGSSGFSGLKLRSAGDNTGFIVFYNRMWDAALPNTPVGGVFSETFVSGDRMRAVTNGTSISIYRQAGATGPWTQVMTTTSATYQTNTKHGLGTHGTVDTDARYDDFAVYTYSNLASSTTVNATIVRTASGAIQRLSVTDPDYVRVELVTAGDVVVVSVELTDDVIMTGTGVDSAAGTGSFELTLLDGTATAAGTGWSASVPYTGSPTKVRLVSLGGSYVEESSFPIVDATDNHVAIAASGNVYITYVGTKLVRKYTSAGTFVTSWSTTGTPNGIAVDSAENVYVADFTNDLVRKYNSSGAAGITWASSGATGIGIDSSDNIYVGDDAGVVRKYNISGTPLTSWGVVGDVTALTAQPDGTVVAADYDVESRIERFNSTGGAPASGDDLFSTGDTNDNLVTVDAAGNIWIAPINGTGTLTQFDKNGVELTTLSVVPNTRSGAAITSDNKLHLVDTSADTMRTFAPTTASIGAITVTPATPSSPFYETVTTQLDVDEAWLLHPSQPSLSVSIDPGPNLWRDDGINVAIESAQTTVAKSSQTLHYPIGRARAVAISHGNRLDDEWALVLTTPRLQDRDAVRAIIRDQTPLLVRSPDDFGWDLEDGFYAVGDVDTSRYFAPLAFPERRITLPLIPSDPPVVTQSGLRTYADLLLEAGSYSDLLAIYDTYTDLLAGNA